jgi:hypothetical protein
MAKRTMATTAAAAAAAAVAVAAPAFKALRNTQQSIRLHGDSDDKQKKLATARSAYATQTAHGKAAKSAKQL